VNNTAKHTPGPWTLERDRAKSLSLYSGSTFIGEVYHEVDEPSTQEQANAHLIAAAPAMYEALQTLVEYLSAQVPADTLDDWKHVFAARQALTQAEGK